MIKRNTNDKPLPTLCPVVTGPLPLCAWPPTQQLTAPLSFGFLGCSREELSRAGLPPGVTKLLTCYPGTQTCSRADQEVGSPSRGRTGLWEEMRWEGGSGRGTGLGLKGTLGSGREVSQPWAALPWGLGLAWAGATLLLEVSTDQEVAAAPLAPGLSWARSLPSPRGSAPEPHCPAPTGYDESIPQYQAPTETQTGSCVQSPRVGGQGPQVTAGGSAHLSGSWAGPGGAAGEDLSGPHTKAESYF